jgi:Cu-Zn family superoxide dismutase
MKQPLGKPGRGYAPWVALAGILTLAACTSLGPLMLEADATLLPTHGGSVRGTVSLVERADGVQVIYNLAGLMPNSSHALHIHEQGDCNALDASSAGPIFSPNALRLKRGAVPDGALGTVRADINGVATGFLVARYLTLDGINSVVGRAVIVHRDEDQDDGTPDLGAGPALACGVLRAP